MSAARWSCIDANEGLCVPSLGGNAPHATLGDCHETCRPGGRSLRWYVADSGLGVCKPTLNPVSQVNNFPTAQACQDSHLAHYPELPAATDAQGFICVNRETNQCMATSNVGVPFTYHVYATYRECKEAPECQPTDTRFH